MEGREIGRIGGRSAAHGVKGNNNDFPSVHRPTKLQALFMSIMAYAVWSDSGKRYVTRTLGTGNPLLDLDTILISKPAPGMSMTTSKEAFKFPASIEPWEAPVALVTVSIAVTTNDPSTGTSSPNKKFH